MPIRERRRILPYIILAILLAIISFVAVSVWLNWTILESMYQAKAGLDWFGIRFYGGLTFVIGALIALLFINPNPRRSDLFEAFNALMGLQYRQTSFGGFGSPLPQRRVRPVYIRPSYVLWGFWQVIKFVILFLLFSANNGFPGLGNLTMVVDMALHGLGNWNLVPRIFSLPLSPAPGSGLITLIPSMEIEYQIVSYFLAVAMIVLAIRFFLKFVRDVVIRAGDKWIRDIFVALTAVVFSAFVGIPYWGMDITIPYEWGAVATVLAAFFALSLYFHFKSSKEAVPLAQRRRAGIVAATVIIVALLLVNVGAFTYYRLNFNNNYIAYQWTPLIQKQIQVSRWTTGIQNVSYDSISNLPSGNASKTLSLIRQWDANSASTQSQNRIGVNWLQLISPPEIVYVYGHEYWVSTSTFNYPNPNDWVATHLIYTHSSKIIAMDTHTGQFVNVTQAFRIPTQPLMYYGQDVSGIPGFANDVYVHVQQAPPEEENVTYSGSPDYTLCGAQRAVWFLNQGQVGYAFSPPQNCIQMLHDREVFQRVQSVLINGLVEDTSTYLVTDSAVGGNNLYFAVQVYIDYPLHTGFSEILGTPLPYMRFFGVVLVNIADGSMQGYTVAGSDNFLSSFYKEYYPTWKSPPAWLQAQLRYPEQLLGNSNNPVGQLDADFILHVNDPGTFRSGSDFFERPQITQVLYIPYVIGNNASFTAVQLVEFRQSAGKNLAGLYVVYGGQQLSQMTLYSANSTAFGTVPLLGPTAALNAFNADYATHQAITLTGAKPGNILLYPVQGHLYYFIPAYISQNISATTGSAVIERNPFIDVIDAQNSSTAVRLIYTNSSEAANYGFSGIVTGSNSTLRTLYVKSLFNSQGIRLSNATVTNVNIVKNLGTVQYTLDSQNSTASQFIKNFTSFYSNVVNSGGHVAFDSVFYWYPTTNTIDFGFIVTDQSATELYTISVVVGQ